MIKPKLIPAALAILFSILLLNVSAQDSLQNTFIDISRVGVFKPITGNVNSTYIERKESPLSIYPQLRFTPGLKHKLAVPNNYVTKKALLKFNVCNTADTACAVYFFPSIFYKDISLYRVNRNEVIPLPEILPPIADSMGYRMIRLEPHDSATILAELSFVKTYINTIRPRLINAGHLDTFMATLRSTHYTHNLVTFIFCGLLLMMILFSMTNFFQGSNRDFLYYSGYAFFLGSMLFTKALFDFRLNELSFFLEGYFDYIMQCIGILFYMLFMQRFLDTRTKHPFLYRFYNIGVIILILSMTVYTWFHYFTDNFVAENMVENDTKILLLIMIVVFLVYSVRQWKDKLMRFLFWGNLLLLVFSVISLVTSMLDSLFKSLPGIFSSSLFYYEAGLFLELVFFLAGLNYKNRRNIIASIREKEALKAQNQLKEYEKEIAVYKAQQEERERISADMHDELGSGMTAIRLMSEIARNKMKENTPVEVERISESANDVLNKMNAIIWSMDSGNDSLDNLIYYIRSYSLEYFENTPVKCVVTVPKQIPPKELTGDKRRNIFLCVKETLNNALKHSQASQLTIDIEANHVLVITIRDNGKGIDMQQLRQFGNGLKNIAKRMESIGGTFKIENNNGTLTTLTLPL